MESVLQIEIAVRSVKLRRIGVVIDKRDRLLRGVKG
jgi:hypothetical protein